jgi:hypothetical protein
MGAKRANHYTKTDKKKNSAETTTHSKNSTEKNSNIYQDKN